MIISHTRYMTEKGIIRKLDSLGRIVIPREFRKLNCISIGEPIEISCMDNGSIVLSKVNVDMVMRNMAEPLIKILADNFSGSIMLCNSNEVILAYGDRKGELLGMGVPFEVKDLLEKRKKFTLSQLPHVWANVLGDDLCLECVPIVSESQLYGGLCYLFTARSVDIELPFNLVAVSISNGLEKY